MDYFQLHRNFWDFAFDNPEKIKPNHCAIFSFVIEHCNRLGWREKFGLPSGMVMDAIGIKCYKSYIKALNELVDFGFIKMIEKSKNQYSANVVALINYDKPNTKALTKAITKHATKQLQSNNQSTTQSTTQSTDQSISTIIRPITNIPITINKEESALAFFENNSPSEWESFQMRFRKNFDADEWEKFKELFDCKYVEEGKEFSTGGINARLTRFAINYCSNLSKERNKMSQINGNEPQRKEKIQMMKA